ncbi:MAG: response regulator [Desulfobacterales bacterium]
MRNTKKVLVVDDEPTICRLLKHYLDTQGYEVTVAASGEDALSRFASDQPGIVLLDISMPGMLGTELLERMKKLDETCGIIVLSAYGDEEIIQEVIGKGAYCYIQKPMELTNLSEKLNELQVALA